MMFMWCDCWTVREAVEQAANIWFSKELLDINALLGLSSTGFRHTKFSSLPSKAPTSGRRVFFKERITPRKIILNWHSPDNRECAKRVSLISCRDIGHSSYTGIIFRIARLLRL
ncbi:MAG: hypothetical protein WA624_07120, partial [Methylocella sp.]